MTEATRDYMRGLAILAALALIALVVTFNPAPWSPMGQAQPASTRQTESPAVDMSDFDIPEGWGPGDGARIVIPRAPGTQA